MLKEKDALKEGQMRELEDYKEHCLLQRRKMSQARLERSRRQVEEEIVAKTENVLRKIREVDFNELCLTLFVCIEIEIEIEMVSFPM
jgi:hypothetical protein